LLQLFLCTRPVCACLRPRCTPVCGVDCAVLPWGVAMYSAVVELACNNTGLDWTVHAERERDRLQASTRELYSRNNSQNQAAAAFRSTVAFLPQPLCRALLGTAHDPVHFPAPANADFPHQQHTEGTHVPHPIRLCCDSAACCRTRGRRTNTRPALFTLRKHMCMQGRCRTAAHSLSCYGCCCCHGTDKSKWHCCHWQFN
jgi:hypothetical protein